MLNTRKLLASTLVICLGMSLCSGASAAIDVPLKDRFGGLPVVGDNPQDFALDAAYYAFLLDEYEAKQLQPARGDRILVDIEQAAVPDGLSLRIEDGVGDRPGSAIVWQDDTDWIEFDFDVEAPGLYEIEIDYYLYSGSSSPAVRSMKIDGKYPFREAGNLVFYRIWNDEGEPKINSLGDEVRPGQVETRRWQTARLGDSQGMYELPFRLNFAAGRQTIRMEYIDQPMAIGAIRIVPAVQVPSYAEVKAGYEQKGYREASSAVEFEAESTVESKNDPTIRRESNSDPVCQPASFKSRKLNVIGDESWQDGNQSITWKFTVPEEGLYKIGLHVGHWWGDGLSNYRQIQIDGKVPFSEMLAYTFTYSNRWQTVALEDESGQPYLFYLEEGEHRITMTVMLGALGPLIRSINDDIRRLSSVTTDLIKVSGSNPDPNYDYQYFQTIPDLKGDLETLADSMQRKYEFLKSISSRVPAMANNFLTIKVQLLDMIENPFSIARRMGDLSSAQTSLSSWYLNLQESPLVIDYFKLGAPDTKWENKQSSFFTRLWITFVNFITSFSKDYDNVGSVIGNDTQVKKVIKVWVSRGIEWAELIKEMADESFTPKTGIMVNINELPSSQLNAGAVNALMLAIASGKAPDVAMGVDPASPVEFAIRDAVLDLTSFRDFDEVADRFLPEILIPAMYKGGVYALPETMNFMAMFYRKDIVQAIGIGIPDTRDDLYKYTLPVLYQNGMQFGFPAVNTLEFTQFVFQHGARFYSEDGFRSGLDTPEAYRAFKEVCELYTNYGVPVSANLFNRFRTGEMPMCIGDYQLYMQLSVAAPELAGKWGIAQLPGLRKPDGTVDRSVGSLTQQCDIILAQTDLPDESWEFLRWWTSTEVQSEFARTIEALIGAEARWNTANLESFYALSWNRADIKTIKSQLDWAMEMPVVLGGYFTRRHLTNAWNRVITSGQDVRSALEEAVEDINRELRMKQEEYGVTVQEGQDDAAR